MSSLNVANRLDPEEHEQFLDLLFSAAEVVQRTASGPKLAVIAHYRTEWEQTKRKLSAAQRRRAPKCKD